jgi:hypothetical protein
LEEEEKAGEDERCGGEAEGRQATEQEKGEENEE